MADDKLATTNVPGVLEQAPDYFPAADHRGFEDTRQSDVMIPRLALAQALSPQVTDGDPKRIEGLKVGDLFNSITGRVYGREVFIQLLRKMPLRAMEFRSMDNGGGVVDPDVPIGDPRLAWGNSGDKKADKPIATLFRDFLAVVLPDREMIALSFKSSGIEAAKTLWGLAATRNRPVFAGRYRIYTAVKLTPKPHQIYKVENAGWVSREDAVLGEQMFEAVKVFNAERIDRAADNADDFDIDDSMAANPEPATQM